MSSIPDTQTVRQLVLATLAQLGLSQAMPYGEIILLRDRQYAGRRFDFEGVQAVWSIPKGTVEFFAEDGRLLQTVQVEGQDGASASQAA
ncbi:MAG: hypothetical protein ACYC35_17625 [Pirellulales bacterium]